MATRVREKDWAATPLGPSTTWSPALRNTTNLLLANRFPMLLWWGPESISIYNDAYIPVLGTKHPDALGLPVHECWAEIYDVLRPMIETPLNGGPATWLEDLTLDIRRHGFLEETHWTIAYSPVPDDTAPNGIGGVLATVHEITSQVVATRRNALVRHLSARINEAKSRVEVCAAAAEVFSRYAADVPFAHFYERGAEGEELRLAATTGDRSETDPSAWPIDDAIDAQGSRLAPPTGQRAESALVVPLAAGPEPTPSGALVLGVSTRLVFDDDYRTFFELVATQLTSALANVRARELEQRRAESLAEVDRAKTTFFHNISHEFRTPLTLILASLAEGLDELSDPLTPKQRDRQAGAQKNARRLLKLVNRLLDFSRIEAGRADASYEATDVATLTKELASTFRSLVERAGVRLTIECFPSASTEQVQRAVEATKAAASGSRSSMSSCVSMAERSRSRARAASDRRSRSPSRQATHIFHRTRFASPSRRGRRDTKASSKKRAPGSRTKNSQSWHDTSPSAARRRRPASSSPTTTRTCAPTSNACSNRWATWCSSATDARRSKRSCGALPISSSAMS